MRGAAPARAVTKRPTHTSVSARLERRLGWANHENDPARFAMNPGPDLDFFFERDFALAIWNASLR